MRRKGTPIGQYGSDLAFGVPFVALPLISYNTLYIYLPLFNYIKDFIKVLKALLVAIL